MSILHLFKHAIDNMGLLIYLHTSSKEKNFLIPEDLKFYMEEGFKNTVLHAYWTFRNCTLRFESEDGDDEEYTSITSISRYLSKYFPSWEDVYAEMQKEPSFYPIETWTKESHETFKSDLERFSEIDSESTIMFTS